MIGRPASDTMLPAMTKLKQSQKTTYCSQYFPSFHSNRVHSGERKQPSKKQILWKAKNQQRITKKIQNFLRRTESIPLLVFVSIFLSLFQAGHFWPPSSCWTTGSCKFYVYKNPQCTYYPCHLVCFEISILFYFVQRFSNRLAMHSSKSICVTTSDDASWKMWSVPDCQLIMSGEGHKDWVSDCAFHPKGRIEKQREMASIDNSFIRDDASYVIGR